MLQQLALNPKITISNLPNNTDFVDHSGYRMVSEYVVGVGVEGHLEGAGVVVDKMIHQHREPILPPVVAHVLRCPYDYVALVVRKVLRMAVREMLHWCFVVLVDHMELVGNMSLKDDGVVEVEGHSVLAVGMVVVCLVRQKRLSFSVERISSRYNTPDRVTITRLTPMQWQWQWLCSRS
jgi:hypothetical protein